MMPVSQSQMQKGYQITQIKGFFWDQFGYKYDTVFGFSPAQGIAYTSYFSYIQSICFHDDGM